LQDEQGKRYPPRLEIAKKLLKQKHSVWLMKRSINMYWYEREPMSQNQIEPQESSVPAERVWVKPDYPVSSPELIVPTQSTPLQSTIPVIEPVPFLPDALKRELTQEPKMHIKRSDRFYKRPLPNDSDEWLAQKVYQATGNLQEIEARQLIDKYGREAVGRALERMNVMREKDELQNPAGFMKVVSRVCWLAINGFDTPRPEYLSPQKRRLRKTAYNSKNDPIWQSKSYRLWRLSFKAAPIDIWEIPYFETIFEF